MKILSTFVAISIFITNCVPVSAAVTTARVSVRRENEGNVLSVNRCFIVFTCDGVNTATFTPTNTFTPKPTFTPSKTPTVTRTNTPTQTPSDTPTPRNTATATATIVPGTGEIVIAYVYDPLNRLTEADYSSGEYYHYAYDSVGNRLTEETHLETNLYAYDNANRLTSVNDVNYSWDNNGNLLSDGANSYAYDSVNRLISGNYTASDEIN